MKTATRDCKATVDRRRHACLLTSVGAIDGETEGDTVGLAVDAWTVNGKATKKGETLSLPRVHQLNTLQDRTAAMLIMGRLLTRVAAFFARYVVKVES